MMNGLIGVDRTDGWNGGKDMKKRPKLLITGANGFTGRHACNQLGIDYDITAVSRNYRTTESTKVDIRYFDLTNKMDVHRLVNEVQPDFLLHLAGQNHAAESWNNPIATLEANLMSTVYLLDAIRESHPVCKVVIIGSALQYDPNKNSSLTHPYGLSKTLQVQTAQAWAVLYKLNVVVAKPSNLIGPGGSTGVCSIFAKKIIEMERDKTEKVLKVNNLHARRDFLDVRDAVHAYNTLLRHGKSGEIYDITSGKSHSLHDIIKKYKTLALVDFEVESLFQPEDPPVDEVQPYKLRQLGWSTLYPLDSSLRDTLDYYRNT
ncbi:NAD-dependent epimerase/dehydratase family protein [Fictibacillus terranigra]|uniref:NAD-dependent epimerase/dehydratase family protein n=1 Tax=Fictibacillus terranigra TaxID=3058424 RepID=A0ABT8E6X8_9BACL|nr:NAD-dependent epimerase/dehydratase family protein [Fictibacillus sp. CENA-BCM004]MDN4073662.1 NAD-dependent epimerase/dehydratase family protein [Fictibacillus sp. CENA-BCM004]